MNIDKMRHQLTRTAAEPAWPFLTSEFTMVSVGVRSAIEPSVWPGSTAHDRGIGGMTGHDLVRMAERELHAYTAPTAGHFDCGPSPVTGLSFDEQHPLPEE